MVTARDVDDSLAKVGREGCAYGVRTRGMTRAYRNYLAGFCLAGTGLGALLVSIARDNAAVVGQQLDRHCAQAEQRAAVVDADLRANTERFHEISRRTAEVASEVLALKQATQAQTEMLRDVLLAVDRRQPAAPR